MRKQLITFVMVVATSVLTSSKSHANSNGIHVAHVHASHHAVHQHRHIHEHLFVGIQPLNVHETHIRCETEKPGSVAPGGHRNA